MMSLFSCDVTSSFCENRLVVFTHILFLKFKEIKVEGGALCPKMRSWWQCFQFSSSILNRILFMLMLVDSNCLIILLLFKFYYEKYLNVCHVLNVGHGNSFIFPQAETHVLTQPFLYWDASWNFLEISTTFSKKGKVSWLA